MLPIAVTGNASGGTGAIAATSPVEAGPSPRLAGRDASGHGGSAGTAEVARASLVTRHAIAAVRGSSSVKRVPARALESNTMRPPWAAAICWTM